eukprot:scaffold492940_cov48-Prasinocladus_malaysianus.AAC.1
MLSVNDENAPSASCSVGTSSWQRTGLTSTNGDFAAELPTPTAGPLCVGLLDSHNRSPEPEARIGATGPSPASIFPSPPAVGTGMRKEAQGVMTPQQPPSTLSGTDTSGLRQRRLRSHSRSPLGLPPPASPEQSLLQGQHDDFSFGPALVNHSDAGAQSAVSHQSSPPIYLDDTRRNAQSNHVVYTPDPSPARSKFRPHLSIAIPDEDD